MSDAASPRRVSFDFTPADLADVMVASALGTTWARKARRRYAIVAGVVGLAAGIPILLLLGGVPHADQLLPFAAVLIPLGVTIGLMYFLQFEFRMHGRVLRALTVELGDVVLRCDVELRHEGLWVRQRSVEILHYWSVRLPRWTSVTHSSRRQRREWHQAQRVQCRGRSLGGLPRLSP